MTIRNFSLLLLVAFVSAIAAAEVDPAPAIDRVGFPKDYQTKFQVLRSVTRAEKQQLVTVFGNDRAASVARTNDLPYPYGSVIVMETAAMEKNAPGKALLDPAGKPRKAEVVGLHVMRKEKGYGEAYGENRSGEWEYTEYRPDGTYITPPQKSAACSACHVKAERSRDFVYHGKLAVTNSK